MNPIVSVIVPVYNVAPYLRRCIDSILAQTYSDWELICVDDGSTDESPDILRSYADREERMCVLYQTNSGQSAARNAGTARARGQYINYVDADDFIHPQTLELAVAIAGRDGSDIVTWVPDMVYKRRLIARDKLGMPYDGVEPWSLSRRYAIETVRSVCTNEAAVHTTNFRWDAVQDPIRFFYPWRHLIRRELAAQVPFVEGLRFEDFPWWSELLLRSPRITITQLPLYYYYLNKQSTTSQFTVYEWIVNWLRGIKHIFPLYAAHASVVQWHYWSRQCLWAVIIDRISKQLHLIRSEELRASLVPLLAELWEMGVFAAPYNQRSQYHRGRIQKYIGL